MTITQIATVTLTGVTSTILQTVDRPTTGNNLGPLTTVFTPPPGCDECYVDAKSVGSVCAAYFTNWHGPRSCMPGSDSWSFSDFYSPGLLCPSGWTTATVVSADMTDSIRASEVLSRLSHEETAAFCCPAGFTFTYGTIIPNFTSIPPLCLSTLVKENLVYHLCGTDGSDNLRTAAVGTSTFTTTFETAWTDMETNRVDPDPSLWVTETRSFSIFTTATTTAFKDAITQAPVVQLVWRPEDQLPILNPDFSQSTVASGITTGTPIPSPSTASPAGTPLTSAVIAGIAVGGTTFVAFLLLAIMLYIKRHRRNAKDASAAPDENTKSHANTSASGGELEPGQKPELDATSAADANGKRAEKQELLAEPITPPSPSEPQTSELDAGPITPELPAKESTSKFPPNRRGLAGIPESAPAQVTPGPVSPVSQQSSPEPPHTFSSPSLMSSIGGHDSYLAEGWRASMLRD